MCWDWKRLLPTWEQKSDWQVKKTSYSMGPWETQDTLRSDKLLLFFHPGSFTRKPTKFDSGHINSIYLREEMRRWVRGGEAGLKHNRNQMPLNRQAQYGESFSHRVYFVIRLLFCVFIQLRYGRMWARDKNNEEGMLGITTQILDLSLNWGPLKQLEKKTVLLLRFFT